MLLSNMELIAAAPGGVAKLRELILTLAVQGKLVPQDPADEPASVLLQKIRAEKDRLIADGKIKRDKPLAEIAEEEKPFELPQGWEWVRFGDASINRDGERIPVSSSERENRAKVYDYYGASGVIDKIDGFLFDTTLLLIGEDGANLINRSTPIAFLAHGKYWVNNHAHVIDTTHPELMTYLALFINAICLEPYVTGTAQPKMNQAKLNSIVIALPPLAEQSRIVTRVEALMRLCDALEAKGQLEAAHHAQLVSTLLGTLTASTTPEELAANWQRVAQHFDLLLDRPEAIDALEQTLLQLAVRGLLVPQDPTDEPASALLQKIRAEKDRLIATGQIKRDKPLSAITDEEKPFELPVGWEWVTVADVCSVVTDGEHATPERCDDPSQVPLVTAKNVRSETMDYSVTDYVPRPVAEQCWKRCKPEVGDVLMVSVGATLGRLSVLRDAAEMVLVRSVTVLRPVHVGLDVSYFALHLMSPRTQREIWGSVKQSAQPCLYLAKSSALKVALPPLAEQSRIVTRVTALRRLCSDLRQRLAERQSVQARLAEALVQAVT